MTSKFATKTMKPWRTFQEIFAFALILEIRGGGIRLFSVMFFASSVSTVFDKSIYFNTYFPGPAVYGLRAQIDRKLYKQNIQKEMFEKTPNLTIQASAVENLHIKPSEKDGSKPSVGGVILQDGCIIESKTVVITTGTFLKGEIFLGLDVKPAGRIDESASYGLSETLTRLGFRLDRLRTGTPPRLDKRTINFDGLRKLCPDKIPVPFSFMNKSVWIPYEEQLYCFLTFTNAKVSEIVKNSVHLTQHMNQEVNGPRYETVERYVRKDFFVVFNWIHFLFLVLSIFGSENHPFR